MSLNIINSSGRETGFPIPHIPKDSESLLDPSFAKFHILDEVTFDLSISSPACICRFTTGKELQFSLSEKEIRLLTAVEMGKNHPLDLFGQIVYPNIPEEHVQQAIVPQARSHLRTLQKDKKEKEQLILNQVSTLSHKLDKVSSRMGKFVGSKSTKSSKKRTVVKIENWLQANHGKTVDGMLSELHQTKDALSQMHQKVEEVQFNLSKYQARLLELEPQMTPESKKLLLNASSTSMELTTLEELLEYQSRSIQELNSLENSCRQITSKLEMLKKQPGSSAEIAMLENQHAWVQHQLTMARGSCTYYEKLIPPSAKEMLSYQKHIQKSQETLKKLKIDRCALQVKLNSLLSIEAELPLSKDSKKKYEKYKDLHTQKWQLQAELDLSDKELTSLEAVRKQKSSRLHKLIRAHSPPLAIASSSSQSS